MFLFKTSFVCLCLLLCCATGQYLKRYGKYYNDYNYDSGYDDYSSHIINGRDAEEGEFSFIAQYGFVNGTYKGVLCASSIISERWLLTAAHCIRDRKNNKIYRNFTPAVFSNSIENVMISPLPITHRLTREISHPLYNGQEGITEYDIGMLQINDTFRGQYDSKSISIAPASFTYESNDEAITAGWGETDPQNAEQYGNGVVNTTTVTAILQKLPVVLKSVYTCRNYDPNVTELMICAHGNLNGPCYGDSGGPLIFHKMLIGVASMVPAGCPVSNPSIAIPHWHKYANVAKFNSWINEIMNCRYK